MSADEARSPCNSICSMDEITGFCAGCLRTLDEIAAWGQLQDDDKRAILHKLAERRARNGEAVLARWERSTDAQR